MPEVRVVRGEKGVLGVLLRRNRKENRRLMLFVSHGRRLIAQVSRRARPSAYHRSQADFREAVWGELPYTKKLPPILPL